jgi:hypothetical protein
MAQQKKIYVKKKKTSRGHKLRPLNLKKSLGPKSGWRGMKKRKRRQGGT